ncbi:putative pentatricopeptide repeat protein [Diplodia seriata]|uniref:Putative pentatricopeptide repeat protein n=1 Tax=Diplodia seriata TaxID=420778 RepID=A0A0G2DWU7_9PEZI|nr:putative pentatricopeptide repeat protein [Diplodia seriata]
MVNPLRVRFTCSPDKQPYLDLFNLYLWRSLADPTHRKTAKALWRLYIKLQLISPKFLRALSSDAWDLLWRTQSLRTLAEPKVATHLTQLVEDMQATGRVVNFEQRLVYIETLFGQGAREAAIEKWQQGYRTESGSRTGDSYRSEYLELGVRIHAVAGDVTRAQELLADLFASHPVLNPRLILYVFDACLQAPDEGDKHAKQAWALYLHLKDLLGDSMAVKDFEKCYTGFLKAGYSGHAFAVFRDLMSAEALRGSEGHKANASILKGYNDLAAVLDSEDQLNEVFLTGLSSMPQIHQNKFFFGKWINKLIAAGDVDSAVRSGDPSNIDKAENLALQMVVKRITTVRRRKGLVTSPPRDLSAKLRPPPKLFLRRTLPPATSDTFGFLRQIYLQRNDRTKLESLCTCQVLHAELRTTTEVLNMQLSFYLQRGYLSDVWRTFKHEVLLRPSPKVKPTRPDIGTFALLWEASHFKQRTLGRSTPYDLRSPRTSFPPPTIILRHTLAWSRNDDDAAAADDPKLRDRDRSLLLLEALSELTRAILLRQGEPPARIEAQIHGIKRSLGDDELPTGDRDAWEIARELGIR